MARKGKGNESEEQIRGNESEEHRRGNEQNVKQNTKQKSEDMLDMTWSRASAQLRQQYGKPIPGSIAQIIGKLQLPGNKRKEGPAKEVLPMRALEANYSVSLPMTQEEENALAAAIFTDRTNDEYWGPASNFVELSLNGEKRE